MRTGVSASRIPRKPSLLWVTEVGPSVSSPTFEVINIRAMEIIAHSKESR